MSLISYAMRMAKEYYDEKTYAHAARVAQYVAENNLISDDKMDACIALAWMHDFKEVSSVRLFEPTLCRLFEADFATK